MSNVDERKHSLAAAGYNVLNLDPADVEIDLLSDVPHHPVTAQVRDARVVGAREPNLEGLAARLYGEARYVFATMGRAAEDALVSVLERPGGVVLTHGLFFSTEKAFARGKMQIELAPGASATTADIDLAWLEKRLEGGRVDAVCLEPSNNALAGWTLHRENVVAVKKLCRARSVLLLIDATRVFANCAGANTSVFEEARALLEHADAFTASCAKEALVPFGALVGVRDVALAQRVWSHCFERGTLLGPLAAKVQLARGFEEVLARPELFADRKRQLELLAQNLRALGIPIIEPIGGHAVYVDAGGLALRPSSTRARALEGVLYVQGGVRGMIAPASRLQKTLLRLPITPARYRDEDMVTIARAVRAMFDASGDVPELAPVEGVYLHPLMARFERRIP